MIKKINLVNKDQGLKKSLKSETLKKVLGGQHGPCNCSNCGTLVDSSTQANMDPV